ncbi:hypothetical protein M407DRAFT_162462 [Tulasnella calospora MUT 4182]|uniref:NAD(P)H-hydrate epimerase n=1 Tax=Tulasnella calospora MUT 4182 TaxID=1051891 RepID=A0A0C3QNU5_9AGAM|nr:hypothetical protein M407DRAFT_162462 [Tulasnella calospora MUT 4182]
MSRLRYLTSKLAQEIDEELMNSSGAFSLDQLMELAGLACAQTLATVYDREKFRKVLVCCGPGNQGGDGLVAARHLAMFGYEPTVYMPKPGSKDIYQRLQQQCTNCAIPTISTNEELKRQLLPDKSDCILDAIFGFSFKPPVRAPFDEVLPLLNNSKLPIVSVDIPSGWDVEKGPVELKTNEGTTVGDGLNADVLISLTAPKEGVMSFRGRHFLGGRFVPKILAEKYALNLPDYPGFAQIVELPSNSAL